MPDFAPGLPDKHVYGELSKLTPGEVVDYVLQHHSTRRNPTRPHFDLRLGTPETNLFSWAIPGAVLPGPGEKKLAPQTQLHTHQYGEFQGPIEHGYGAGYVKRQDKGKALITKVTPDTVNFTLAHSKIPTRFSLIRMKTPSGRDWLLINRPVASTAPGVGDKPKYQLVEAGDLDEALAKAESVQEKIDGAHGIFDIGKGGKIEAYSVNPRVTGEAIPHAERLGLYAHKAPSLAGTTLRGEMYGVSKETGKAIPFSRLSGILNAGIAKSLEKQKAENVQMRSGLFDIIKYKGKPMQDMSDVERQELLDRVVARLPSDLFHKPLTGVTPKEKAKIVTDIRTGRNPRTEEGVVMRMPDGTIKKFKLRPESTAYLAGLAGGQGKRKATAGGLLYSLEPGGKAVGNVGTGFTDQELQDIVSRVQENMGRPIRIAHQGQFPSGKFRAPSFQGFETDVPDKTAESHGTIGVDLDGTLAKYDRWRGKKHIGEPVKRMVERVKRWIAEGRDVQIFTARADSKDAIAPIKFWCKKHLGKMLPVTNVKTPQMTEIWDDRAIGVHKNTGIKKANVIVEHGAVKIGQAFEIPWWIPDATFNRDDFKGIPQRGSTTNVMAKAYNQFWYPKRKLLQPYYAATTNWISKLPADTQAKMDAATTANLKATEGKSTISLKHDIPKLIERYDPDLTHETVMSGLERKDPDAAAKAYKILKRKPGVAQATRPAVKTSQAALMNEVMPRLVAALPYLAASSLAGVRRNTATSDYERTWQDQPRPRFFRPRAPENATVISNYNDLDRFVRRVTKNKSPEEAQKLRRAMQASLAQTGLNAFSGVYENNPAVIIRRDAPLSVYSHEYGHINNIIDRIRAGKSTNAHPVLSVLAAPFVGAKRTPAYREEEAAWDRAGIKPGDPMRDAALRTYESGLKGVEWGARYGIPGYAAIRIMQGGNSHGVADIALQKLMNAVKTVATTIKQNPMILKR